jgi:predicted  nucleic acid-binding Zn-ribbon protein
MLQRRNDLKAEIDILTDRLCVLQDQLKEYSDISEEIKELEKKRALLSLEVLGLSQQVDIKKDRIKKEGQILSEIQSEINK